MYLKTQKVVTLFAGVLICQMVLTGCNPLNMAKEPDNHDQQAAEAYHRRHRKGRARDLGQDRVGLERGFDVCICSCGERWHAGIGGSQAMLRRNPEAEYPGQWNERQGRERQYSAAA